MRNFDFSSCDVVNPIFEHKCSGTHIFLRDFWTSECLCQNCPNDCRVNWHTLQSCSKLGHGFHHHNHKLIISVLFIFL